MNVAGPVRASRPIDGGNNYGKLPRSSHGGGDTAAGGVNMYLDIPSFELSLDEFEEYALSRLKVSIIKQSPVSPVICVFVVLPPDQVAVMTLWMVASLTYILKGAAMNEINYDVIFFYCRRHVTHTYLLSKLTIIICHCSITYVMRV